MKKLTLTPLALLAQPLSAHELSHEHLHPHGFEAIMVIALALGLLYVFGRAK